METQAIPRSRVHPLLATAAVAVTIASAVGIAAMTGLLPSGAARQAEQRQADPVVGAPMPVRVQPPVAAVAPEPAPAVQPAPKPAVKAASVAKPRPAARQEPVQVAQAPWPAPQPEAQAGQTFPSAPPDYRPAEVRPAPAPVAKAMCLDCGVVDSMREVEKKGEGSGIGAVAGGVLGAVLGSQVGGGKGKKIATVVGAAGGAYGGHQIEKHQRSTKSYEVSVRMEDGGYRTVTYDTAPTWRAGDRVRVVNGTLQSSQS